MLLYKIMRLWHKGLCNSCLLFCLAEQISWLAVKLQIFMRFNKMQDISNFRNLLTVTKSLSGTIVSYLWPVETPKIGKRHVNSTKFSSRMSKTEGGAHIVSHSLITMQIDTQTLENWVNLLEKHCTE